MALSLSSFACVVSPIPQPPNVDPPELDLDLVAGRPCENCDISGVALRGGAGAVTSPADGAGALILWAVNLDDTEPPQTAPVEPDGSFEVAFLEGESFHHYRLQARRGELRGRPLDVTFTSDRSALVEVSHPLSRCLSVDLELDFGDVGGGGGEMLPLELRDLCAEPITVEAVTLRAPTEAFRLGELPTEIPPFDAVSFGVEFTGPTSGAGRLHEEILLIEARGEAQDRRAVTLIAGAR